jgi:hypothetical protein
MKAGGTALQNLFSLYADLGGKPALTPLPVSFAGLTGTVMWGLSQRSDGSYLLAIWNSVQVTDLPSPPQWSSTANYAVGAYAYVPGTGLLAGLYYRWKAVAASGPGNGGPVTPGTNTAVWQAVWDAGVPTPPAAVPATMTIAGRQPSAVTAYRPVQGSTGNPIAPSAGSYAVPVYGDPTILKITP